MSQANASLGSISPEVQEIVDRIPLFANAPTLSVAPLEGIISLNNANYRVNVGETSYLLRVGAESARYLGIRREEEIEAAYSAAKAGVAPAVLYAEPCGVMVSPFIEGKHWGAEAFHEPANIVRIADTLRRLHAVKDVAAQGSEYRRIDRLIESAVSLGLTLPPNIGALCEKLARIEQERLSDPCYVAGLAHNDFWANNFLDDGEDLYLVDWEFSGTGDTLTDLATISMAGGLSLEEQVLLLDAYGLDGHNSLEVLETMRWVVSFFEAMWALVMDGLRGSGSDTSGKDGAYNYANHAQKMFERL